MKGINHDFIKKDDWGIRMELRKIYGKPRDKDFDFNFHAFVNQWLPPTYYETRSVIFRHLDQIGEILKNQYQTNWVWIERNNQYSCAIITHGLMQQIEAGTVRLPYYLEIEEEKKRWQQKPGYDSQQGYSNPIKEEYIQLNIKGGENKK